MRYFILALIIFCVSIGSILSTAEAARFGGGKSFGMSRTFSSNRSYHPGNAAAPRQSSPGSRWLGPLAGLAIGGLLASLFMGHGMGAGLMSWLLVGGVVFLIWRVITGLRRGNQYQAQSQGGYSNAVQFRTIEGNLATSSSNSPYTQFDEETFLRHAKAIFIRLQAAFDNKNLLDIRTFTSPEVFAEIQLQINERGNTDNFTEVLNIHADLADVNIQTDSIITSVTFSGQLREGRDALPAQIKEVWHFQQLKNQTEWKVMGIQQ
jgi:predicted lipid-binding transport protein (Tim44 family)